MNIPVTRIYVDKITAKHLAIGEVESVGKAGLSGRYNTAYIIGYPQIFELPEGRKAYFIKPYKKYKDMTEFINEPLISIKNSIRRSTGYFDKQGELIFRRDSVSGSYNNKGFYGDIEWFDNSGWTVGEETLLSSVYQECVIKTKGMRNYINVYLEGTSNGTENVFPYQTQEEIKDVVDVIELNLSDDKDHNKIESLYQKAKKCLTKK